MVNDDGWTEEACLYYKLRQAKNCSSTSKSGCLEISGTSVLDFLTFIKCILTNNYCVI